MGSFPLSENREDSRMERQMILELLLKDKSHDELIERPEIYSIEEDIYQWMFETRDYWNEKIPKIMERERKSYEELKRDEPEYYWQYEVKYDTEECILRWAWEHYRRERGRERHYYRGRLAYFWRRLLTARPEFAPRCPWRVFRGDHIWMALQDEAFCKAMAIPKAEIALKMPLKLMSRPDWEALLETIPELQPEFDRLVETGYKFEAYCW